MGKFALNCLKLRRPGKRGHVEAVHPGRLAAGLDALREANRRIPHDVRSELLRQTPLFFLRAMRFRVRCLTAWKMRVGASFVFFLM